MRKVTIIVRPLELSLEYVRNCHDVIGWRRKFSKHQLPTLPLTLHLVITANSRTKSKQINFHFSCLLEESFRGTFINYVSTW